MQGYRETNIVKYKNGIQGYRGTNIVKYQNDMQGYRETKVAYLKMIFRDIKEYGTI